MTTRGTILITDCDHPSIDVERDILSAAGWTVTLARCRTADEVVEAGGDATALIVQYAPITGGVLRALPAVRAVGRYGVGLDTVDTVAAAELGVAVRNVPDYCVDEVADHALGLILALTRGIVALDRGVQQGTWDFRLAGRVRRASSQRLGIIGVGRIGSALAHRALALGYDVVGCDPRGPARTGLPMVDLPTLLATSDIVSIHAPLDDSTRHLIDADALGRMRPTAVPREHEPRRPGRWTRPGGRPERRSDRRRGARRARARADRAGRSADRDAERDPDPARGLLQRGIARRDEAQGLRARAGGPRERPDTAGRRLRPNVRVRNHSATW